MNTVVSSTALLAALATFTLAGCGDGGAPQAPTAAPSMTVGMPKRLAGSWLMTKTTKRYEATGLSPEMAGMAQAGQASVGRKDVGGPVCLSPERAAADTLDTRLQEAIRFGSEWKEERREFSNGRVSFAASKQDATDGEARIAIIGDLSVDRTTLTLVTSSRQVGRSGRIDTETVTDNRRVGDCSPGQDPIS